MKKGLLFLAACCIAMGAMAQLKVESNGDVLFPRYSKVSLGDLYLPYNKNIRFGGDSTCTNPQWFLEYGNAGLNFGKPNGSTNAGNNKLFLSDYGQVGIGCGNPLTAKLQVKGQNILLQTPYQNCSSLNFDVTTTNPRIEPTTTVTFFKADHSNYANIQYGTAYQSSDSTLKTNIKRIEGDVLSKVCKLDGYTYNWKSDKDGQLQVGFIAQEVEKVFPELVETIDSSNMKLMSYIGMIPYLLEAIKAQQVQIEDLKEQLGDSYGSAELKSYSIIYEENSEAPASLSQNKPNPFSSETRIEMFVPKSVANATLYVYDLQGKQVKSITVTGRGVTFEIIHGSELQAGLYIYSLVTDGKLVSSKQMVLTE